MVFRCRRSRHNYDAGMNANDADINKTSEEKAPDRNLAMELVRVTEIAAMAAAQWVGRGDKEAADGAAVDAMRATLAGVAMDGVIIIGEGEKDNAPMLFNGERVGDGTGGKFDIAVDPIDGTTLTAKGRANALAVIGVSDEGTMFDPGPCVYMDKIAVGPAGVGCIDLNLSPAENVRNFANHTGQEMREVVVTILERDRHTDLIKEIRETGAIIHLISDGDVAGAIATAWPDSGVDMLFGIGGTPEGVITACALKCMGGEIQGRLHPRDEEERKAALDAGYDLDLVLTTNDLVKGDDCFFAATGITTGDLLKGVHFENRGAFTQSLVMRSTSGTIRRIDARHNLSKLGHVTKLLG